MKESKIRKKYRKSVIRQTLISKHNCVMNILFWFVSEFNIFEKFDELEKNLLFVGQFW